jgi:hypothetical protein
MRWLLICLLVSLGALLLAAAGVARHVWIKHRELSGRTSRIPTLARSRVHEPADEIDIEPEV